MNFPADGCNYDVVNWEILTVKLVLEWRHWLERMKQPFIVWTDCIHVAKRLNYRQIWWAFFHLI